MGWRIKASRFGQIQLNWTDNKRMVLVPTTRQSHWSFACSKIPGGFPGMCASFTVTSWNPGGVFFSLNSHLNVNCSHRDSITQNPLQLEIPAVNSVLHYSTILPPPHGRNALNWKNRSTFLSLISTGNSISWKHLHCRDTRCYCALPALSYTGSGATACVFRGRCQEMEIK